MARPQESVCCGLCVIMWAVAAVDSFEHTAHEMTLLTQIKKKGRDR